MQQERGHAAGCKKVSILDHEEIMEDEHDIESGSDVESDSEE